MGFIEGLKTLFSGAGIALLGGVITAALGGVGSIQGVSKVGKTGMGVLAEDPNLFGKVLILQALPATNGIYGLLVWFMVMLQAGFFNGSYTDISILQGVLMFVGCVPSMIVFYPGAVKQGEVSSAGCELLLKRPGEQAKALVLTAMIETYAIFALLISVLVILYV